MAGETELKKYSALKLQHAHLSQEKKLQLGSKRFIIIPFAQWLKFDILTHANMRIYILPIPFGGGRQANVQLSLQLWHI